MGKRSINLDDRLYDYLIKHSFREKAILQELRAETATMTNSIMQIAPEQGQLMQLLLKLMKAKFCIEIGVFTGYSTLCTALALPENGKIIACDVNEKWTNIARKFWKKAGVDHKIDLHLSPAEATLKNLLDQGQAGHFDFVFIDADKTNYGAYYELGLTLLRPGGLIAIDNVLWDGAVADEQQQDEDTRAIRALNEKVYQDQRVDISMLSVADGLTLALKK